MLSALSVSPSTFFLFYALLFLVPHWESLPMCVSWVLADAFYDSEECECVGIFKHSSALQLSTIVILHSLPAKTNMAIVGMSLCSEFITGRGELASIVLIDLDPHSLPLDLEYSVCGNTHVSPLFLFVYRQRVFYYSLLERSIISPASKSSSVCESSHWEITPILKPLLIHEDEVNPEQQTLRRAVVGTPLGFPYPSLRCSVREEKGFYRWVLRVRCGRKGKQFWRQDMCLYSISFLEALEGNICLLTPTLTHKHTIGLLHPCTLRKWILSVRIRGFPGGEVHGGDRKFGQSGNADAGCCRAGQGYSALPQEPFCVCVHVYIWLYVHAVSPVYAWTLLPLRIAVLQAWAQRPVGFSSTLTYCSVGYLHSFLH